MENILNINFGKGHILAVEDSLVQAKQIKRFFDKNNIPCIICRNGAEALESAQSEKPILIISDIIMPVMNGYELCTRVKQHADLKDIPVILLTSLSDPLDIIKGLQAGADNFITKPYDNEYLMSRINYLIANQAMRKMGAGDMNMEIIFQNQKFQINSDKKQILDLLLSVYEAAINRNQQLIDTQRQLQVMNENLQAANKELEAFSYTVSHDLKTPLTGVMGYADILKSDLEDYPDKTVHTYLNRIMKSAHKMSRLIEDLLAFSRSGRAEVVAHEVNLSVMAKDIVQELREISFKKDYEVHIQDNVMAYADPGLMRVVMNNLLGNALKYSQNATTPKISFGKEMMGGREVYQISDNGVGFEMAKADHLFRPFMRLHDKNQYQGTGVGLSTVKRILDRHGGAIWFSSAPNEGTTFFFSING